MQRGWDDDDDEEEDRWTTSAEVRLICKQVTYLKRSYGLCLSCVLTREVLSNATVIAFCIITGLPKVIWEEGRVAAKVSPRWLQWRATNSPPKVPIAVDRLPNPTTCLIPGPVRPMMPNGIRIRSAVFPQCTAWTDRRTDRQIVHEKV